MSWTNQYHSCLLGNYLTAQKKNLLVKTHSFMLDMISPLVGIGESILRN